MRRSPIELVTACALATLGAGEQPPGSNRGPFVELCQAAAGGKAGDPWCADFMARVGTVALGSAWPVPRTGSCYQIGAWARAKQILFAAPRVGDLFLIWHVFEQEPARFGHVGLVVGLPNDTISGNTTLKAGTDPKLAREGWAVARKPWPFRPEDRFVRWASLVSEDT